MLQTLLVQLLFSPLTCAVLQVQKLAAMVCSWFWPVQAVAGMEGEVWSSPTDLLLSFQHFQDLPCWLPQPRR